MNQLGKVFFDSRWTMALLPPQIRYFAPVEAMCRKATNLSSPIPLFMSTLHTARHDNSISGMVVQCLRSLIEACYYGA